MNTTLSPRQQAIADGEPFYFTGVPCHRGHLSKRFLGGGCVACHEYIPVARRPARLALNWLQLTEAQLERWYARIDQIRQFGRLHRKHKPLQEFPIVYQPRMHEVL